MKFGSITTGIIADGLVFNVDAANRASYPKEGTIITDTIASATGSFINGPTFLSPPTSASCWEFDGVDEGVAINGGNGIEAINVTNGLSVDCWVKSNGFSSWDYLCSSGGTGGTKSQLQLRFASNGGLYTSYQGSSYSTGISDWDDGNWHHLAMTLNYNNGDVKFYKNAIQGSTVLTYGSTYSEANFKYIGTTSISGDNAIAGCIASLKLYNILLSPNQVLHNYNALKGRFGLT